MNNWIIRLIFIVMLFPSIACGPSIFAKPVTPTPTKTPTPPMIATDTPTPTPVVVVLPTNTPLPAEDNTISTEAETTTDQDITVETATPVAEELPTDTPTPEPPTATPEPEQPTNTPAPPPPPTNTPIPPTDTPVPLPTDTPVPPGPDIIIELPSGDTYGLGDDIPVIVVVRDANGVKNFSWGVVRARIEAMPGAGGEQNCNGATECRAEGKIPAVLVGEFEVGVEAVNSQNQHSTGFRQLYIN